MELQIVVLSNELDPERLHASTMELRRTILEETEATVSKSAVVSETGAKGDPITIGSLAVTFLTSGAAVSIFKVIEAYVTRKRSIDLEISRPDGTKFVLHTEDVSPEAIAATQKAFESFSKLFECQKRATPSSSETTSIQLSRACRPCDARKTT
jgi:hypothetical protein